MAKARSADSRGVFEIALNHRGDAFRAIDAVQIIAALQAGETDDLDLSAAAFRAHVRAVAL